MSVNLIAKPRYLLEFALRNRFFQFGHSGYFLTDNRPDDAFMRRYWVPLLIGDVDPELVVRTNSGCRDKRGNGARRSYLAAQPPLSRRGNNFSQRGDEQPGVTHGAL